MKKIVEYGNGVTDYNVGDVVYLARKKNKLICRARAIKNDNGSWIFKPLRRQSYYGTRAGLIPFCSKPYIFAKEIEIKEEQL